MRRKPIFVAAALAALLVNGALVVLLWRGAGTGPVTAIDDITESLVPLLAAGACLVAGLTLRGRGRIAWWILGASAFAWGTGQIAWSYQELVLHEAPASLFPSWPDIGYLLAVPLGIVGLMAFPALRRNLAERIRALLDGTLMAAGAVFVSWALVLGALYASAASLDSVREEVISLAYPVGDVVMITIVLAALARRRRGSRLPLVFIAAGIVANAVADSTFNYLTTIQGYATGNIADAGWVIGYSLIGLGALYTWANPEPEDVDVVAHWARATALVPYLPVMLAGLTAIWIQLRGQGGDAVLFWDGLIMVAVVMFRQLLIVLDNISLNQSLESKVVERTLDLEARTGELIVERGNLQRREERFRALIHNSSDVVTIIDQAMVIQWVSDSAESVLGYAPRFLLDLPFYDTVHAADRNQVIQTLTELVNNPSRPVAFTVRIRARDGGWRHTEINLTNLLNEPAVAGIVLNIRDVSERRGLEDQLLHQTFHDGLTKLPNRALFMDRLDHEIRRQRGRDKNSLGVMYLDLDGFKSINDSLGHEIGDRLLLLVSDRLMSTVRPGDTVARLGGDEFGVILENISDGEDAVEVGGRVLDSLKSPFSLDDREVFIGASIGIAIPVQGDETALELLQYADLAMYQAKDQGRNAIAIFQPSMQSIAVQRLDMESALRSAVENDEFRLFYQPIVDMDSREVVGVEALIRWFRADGTMVPPLDFIPLAEQSGLIVPIGRWVLTTACSQIRNWQRELPGYSNLYVSVNLSARQLREDVIVDEVLGALRDSGLDPRHLVLEVTESMLVSQTDGSAARLAKFRAHGIRIALDDFGTGYSSLSYLRQMPLDILKIDRSFVMGISDDQATSAVARSIVSLAESLRLGVIAEGIETDVQLDELMRIGCRRGQGYHFARPIPEEDFANALAALRPVTTGQA